MEQHFVIDGEVVDGIGEVPGQSWDAAPEDVEERADVSDRFVDRDLASGQRVQHGREANEDHAPSTDASWLRNGSRGMPSSVSCDTS